MTKTTPIPRLQWLEQVATGPALSGLPLRVAIILARLFNEGTGYAWPSTKFIADHIGATERGVRDAIAALIEHGHLRKESAVGRGRTNRYSPVLLPKKTGTAVPPLDQKTGTALPENRNSSSLKPERHFRQLNKDRQKTLPSSGGDHSDSQKKDSFQIFWATFPANGGDKKYAFRAFARAVRDGADPNEIIEGAKRFAISVRHKDRSSITYAAAWLRDEAWRSLPPPYKPPAPRRRTWKEIIQEQQAEEARAAAEASWTESEVEPTAKPITAEQRRELAEALCKPFTRVADIELDEPERSAVVIPLARKTA